MNELDCNGVCYGFCPNCGEHMPDETSRERRPNGYTTCGECRVKSLSSEWKGERHSDVATIEQAAKAKTEVVDDEIHRCHFFMYDVVRRLVKCACGNTIDDAALTLAAPEMKSSLEQLREKGEGGEDEG